MRYIFLFAFLVFGIIASPLFGSSLENLVGTERAAILRTAAGPISGLQQKTPNPRLMPRHEGLDRFFAEMKSGFDTNLFVESLALYRRPSAPQWSEVEQTGLFNQLVALSTLEGIQYYSESRKAMRIFYESSQVIDGPTGKNPLPDPVYRTLPDSLVLYALQKDLTFGENTYRFSYRTGDDFIFFVQENLTPMNAGIIPVVGKNKCRTMVAIIDAGDSLVVYAAAMAKAASIPGMGDRIGASFTNRINAVFQWFVKRADGVFLNNTH
jgi:hypothetical protein